MIIKGKVWKYGDNVNTDEIIPARYLNTSDSKQLAEHCMEDIDLDFAKRVNKGDIVVALKNFGCGSSREHAPLALKTLGISCIIATSFARIFYRNAFNIGLLLIESDEASEDIEKDNLIEIYLDKNCINNLTKNKTYSINPIPEFMQNMINSGGLMKYIRNKMVEN
ncbi:MAG: 3-isopropylmalate dehydratase small subunit [bacterium]|nr:3-isopropylmalate dehydratase small subunit [bacterium]